MSPWKSFPLQGERLFGGLYHAFPLLLLTVFILAGCSAPGEIATVTMTPFLPIIQTPSPSPSPAASQFTTATPAPMDTGWATLRPGLERRVMHLFDDQNEVIERITILRLEPTLFHFDIVYHEVPQTMADWQEETGAFIVVNGGYYRMENGTLIPTGLMILDGQTIGESYGGFAGMLAITTDGPELRWLEQQPYTPNEPLRAALQSFPLLVKPGGVLGFPEEHEDHLQARRTVIGQDRKGRILLIVTSEGYFTLHQISRYLTESDLDLDIAINLDGGPSSGLILAEPYEEIPAYSPLPIVITIHTR